ncbi:unnamed protein product [Rangifer tarandus platyrhynchus]|uniref:Uncharacterized protein n=1 Tax=Rangifer tarandus platyrhynchus TaxID=3082113 RepID=A0AC59Y9S3_RANTA
MTPPPHGVGTVLLGSSEGTVWKAFWGVRPKRHRAGGPLHQPRSLGQLFAAIARSSISTAGLRPGGRWGHPRALAPPRPALPCSAPARQLPPTGRALGSLSLTGKQALAEGSRRDGNSSQPWRVYGGGKRSQWALKGASEAVRFPNG